MTQTPHGFVAFWRSILNHWVGKDHRTLSIWAYLLMSANWTPSLSQLPRQRIKVQRGQFPTSSRDIASALKLNRKTVERILDLMATDGMIVQRKSHQGTIITIVNYDEWQANPGDACPTKDPLDGPRKGPRVSPRKGPTRTIEQENNKTSFTRKNARSKKSKGLSPTDRARLAVDNLVGIVRSQYEQHPDSEAAAAQAALDDMTPETRALYEASPYPSWTQFVRAYAKQSGGGYGPVFERELRDSFRVQIKRQQEAHQ